MVGIPLRELPTISILQFGCNQKDGVQLTSG
jgi:hypothetical protein